MTVRAKFMVVEKDPPSENGTSIRLVAVTDGSQENKEFFKWTPHGELRLSTVNQAAADLLELDREYYVDISPATPAQETAPDNGGLVGNPQNPDGTDV